MSLPRAAIEQAVQWTAVMRDEPIAAGERREFEAWLHADPAHAQAWSRVQGHLQHAFAALGNADPTLRHALQAPRPSRRHVLRGALALAGVGVGVALLSRPGMPLAEITADLSTGTGERLSRGLADGSRLQLDAQSAVDVHFTPQLRLLVLRAGQLIIDVQRESRPLVVVTPYGRVQSLDARLMVALHPGAAHAWVMGTQADIATRSGATAHLQAGQGARFTDTITLLAPNRSGESRWQDGWLSVVDWPLGDVINALRPYRRGVLRISPQAAVVHVSGTFSLDHSDRALSALEQTMPVRIRRYLDWWTSVELS
ncbi:MAG: DUF4880 domain-containing protein [Pseudomonas sp.]|uniref:FecR domain-containing protein n=1 Tax=Pseudomonas abieticivorans TaxID=2931382 RepID=UPI0020BFE8D1|nr:FecR domain-containing protein [Pseudomonas sp. PIA16]MDE1167602.1 DUF4880 domain-containing protein [Pseudomonas sp.]